MSNNQVKLTVEKGKQETFIEREFEAPREVLFKAMTDPEYVAQWWNDTSIEKLEAKSGGSWRFVSKMNGQEFGFHGVYHEVLVPSRVIETFEYEGLPETGHVILQTSKFEELPGGRSKLTIQQVFQSVADRDGMIQSGMEKGMSESYGRLDNLLEKLAKKD